MYCNTFRPHLPRLQRSSGTQLMPMSAPAISSASRSSLQGQSMTDKCERLRNLSQINFNCSPAIERPSSSSVGLSDCKPRKVLDEPIHTSCTLPQNGQVSGSG